MPVDRQSESLRRRLDAYIRECIDADAWPTVEEIVHIVAIDFLPHESDWPTSPPNPEGAR